MQFTVTNDLMKNTIYENGYGFISAKIMQDKDLSIQAKGIYAYLSSYAFGSNEKVYPKQSTMATHLGMKEDTIRKYLKELYKKGYVRLEKYFIPLDERTSTKQRYRNVYVLTTKIEEIIENTKLVEPPVFEGVQSEGSQSSGGNNNKKILNKKTNLNKKTTTSSSGDYSFLENKKIKGSTKTNIKRYVKDLSEDTFNKYYNWALTQECDNFDKYLYKALKEKWDISDGKKNTPKGRGHKEYKPNDNVVETPKVELSQVEELKASIFSMDLPINKRLELNKKAANINDLKEVKDLIDSYLKEVAS